MSREAYHTEAQSPGEGAGSELSSMQSSAQPGFTLEALMGESARVPEQRKGVWLTHVGSEVFSSKERLKETLLRVKKAGLNTVYPVIWNKGYTTFPSRTLEKYSGTAIDPQFTGRDVLAEIIEINHKENLGLSVVPWFEYGLKVVIGKAANPQKPSVHALASRYPFSEFLRKRGKLLKNKQGEDFWYDATSQHFFGFLNPVLDEDKEFLLNLVSEVIDRYPVDGFQIDDHFSIHADYGFNDEMLSAFTAYLEQKKLLKYDFPNTSRLAKADQDVQQKLWTSFRADTVAALATEIGKKVRARGRNLVYQVSPAGGIGFSYGQWLQNWRMLVDDRIVQEVVVQAYRDDIPSFIRVLEESSLRVSRSRAKVSVGIFTGYKGAPVASKLLIDQIHESVKRGLGFNFFYFDTLFTFDSAREAELGQVIPK